MPTAPCGERLYLDRSDPSWPAIVCKGTPPHRYELAAWDQLGAVLAEPVRPKDAASMLGVTERTIQRWVSGGLLPNHGTDTRIRVRVDEIAAMLRGVSRPQGQGESA